MRLSYGLEQTTSTVSTLSIDAAVFQFASSIVDPFGFGDLVKLASVPGQFGVMFQPGSEPSDRGFIGGDNGPRGTEFVEQVSGFAP